MRYAAPLFLLGSLLACSTYSASSTPTGSQGEPCNEDGSCNGSSLSCVSGACQGPLLTDGGGGGVPDAISVSDSASSDDASGAGDGAIDASKPAPCDALGSAAPDGVVECADSSCLPGRICCGTNHQCALSCADVQVNMPCDGKNDCPMGVCCANLGAAKVNTNICPRSGSFGQLKARCAASCSAGEVEMCTDATCGSGKRCTRLLVQLGVGGTGNFNVSYCE